ncbi:MAG: threonine synthase [Planctomycetales bacterium]|jgi:threonine synthase|nr:threonine synthase [Planctomycetales bacterium]
MSVAFQQCIHPDCAATYDVGQILTACPKCGSLLDVTYDWNAVPVPKSLSEFERRWTTRLNPVDYSGVWRFRELLPFATDEQIVTIGEGQTILQKNDKLARQCDMKVGHLFLQYEGMNPSGSFKDNGMTAASTHARMVGAKMTACASTGNTSASLAIYAGVTGHFQCIVFVGSGKIAFGKLSQALDYGAKTIQIRGDFDDALARVRDICAKHPIYLCNSVNPFRLEGQKTIMLRVLEGLGWQVPDWIVVPGGNLGNSSSFGKAFMELKALGLIDRVPRLAIINASGADTLDEFVNDGKLVWNGGRPNADQICGRYTTMDRDNERASTLASAIEINRPVNLEKALRALSVCNGIVRKVSDQEIIDSRARIAATGFGCEPASGATIAGVLRLRKEGVIHADDRVVCILTGHQLKDPDLTMAYHSGDPQLMSKKLTPAGVTSTPFANPPVVVDNDEVAILKALGLA